MAETKNENRHRLLSLWIIACGLLYIFAYQLKLPFRADTFLYGMLIGVIGMTFLNGKIMVTRQALLFVLIDISAFIGLLYTKSASAGLREAVLFTFFSGLFILSLSKPSLIEKFTKWIYLASIVLVLSSTIHFLFPTWFNAWMSRVLREDAYEQLMWSFTVDKTFAGIAAYTSNATFSAALVFGNSFLNMVDKSRPPIIKSKLLNILLLVLSLFSIIICSKRGIFIATIAAMIVLLFYLYRRRNFILKFLAIAAVFVIALAILYRTNEFVYAFLNRFISDDFTSGRDVIYESLWSDFTQNNIFIGLGTAATYVIAEEGAHNIYIQILYDHGILFSIPYYIFLLYNYYRAFQERCPLSIFVQTLFLVYGLSGNPLYSNMLMMIYIYHVLYAAVYPACQKAAPETASQHCKIMENLS